MSVSLSWRTTVEWLLSASRLVLLCRQHSFQLLQKEQSLVTAPVAKEVRAAVPQQLLAYS